MGGSGIDVWKRVPFLIRVRAELDVWQAIAVFHGDHIPFGRGHGGCITGDHLGFVVDSPPMVFHLSRGCNGFPFRQVCSPTEEEDDITTVGAGCATTGDKGKVTNGVVANSGEVSAGVVVLNETQVIARDDAIGPSVHEGAVEVPRVLTNVVGGSDSVAFVSGR